MKTRNIIKYGILILLAALSVQKAQAQGSPLSVVDSYSTPAFALKTNLLYDSMTTMTLGPEFSVGRQMTIDIPVSYNPWTFQDNRKMKLLMAQPEFRLWTCENFFGHFFGFHLHGGIFNYGGMLPWGFSNGKMFGTIESPTLMNNRYEGYFAGAGVSYGYHVILSKRLSLELTLGAGYAYIKYDKYPCEHCGTKVGEGTRHYLGPTKAAVNLVYMIK